MSLADACGFNHVFPFFQVDDAVIMDRTTSCHYCCSRPSRLSGMDIDAALSELGMLSSVTESRRQYLIEKSRQERLLRPRDRNLSESSTHPTPSNSPNKGGYEIVHINPQFVTSLSAGSLNRAAEKSNGANSKTALTIGAKYSQENIEYEAKSSRLARVKMARLKRFRKPYDVPWRNQMEICYQAYSTPYLSPPPKPTLSFKVETPDMSTRAADCVNISNTSTPEKNLQGPREGTVIRSRSLDELDFAKLRLAEAENHSFVAQKKEIENVSQHLQNLQMN